MSTTELNLKAVERPEVQSITQAVESVIIQKTALSEADHEYVKQVYVDEEAARLAFEKIQADAQVKAGELNIARGARQSFVGYLLKIYALGPFDTLDIETGIITRTPHTE